MNTNFTNHTNSFRVSLFKNFCPGTEAGGAVFSEFEEFVASFIYCAFVFEVSFGEEFVGIANNLFFDGDREVVLQRKG